MQEHLNAKREAHDKVRGVYDKAEAAKKSIAAAVQTEQEMSAAYQAAKAFTLEAAGIIADPPHKV